MFKIIKEIKKLRSLKPDSNWLKKEKIRFASFEEPAKAIKPATPHRLLAGHKLAASLTALLLVVAISATTVNSAQAALPDDILYPIKLLSEKFQSFIIVGSENRVDFALKLAEKRLDEADQANEENIVVGSIERAESKVEEASLILEEISLNKNRGPNSAEKIEKAVARIEKLEEKKKHLATKFEKDLPKAMKALEKLGAVSVEINKTENKITLTFEFSTNATTSTSTSTRKDNNEDGEEINKRSGHNNKGNDRIIELLTDGAGKSGKTPPGLWNAPGIRKKLADFFVFRDHDDDEDDNEHENDDDEEDEDEEDEDNDNDGPTDTTAPIISSLSASSVASTSGIISWTTNEPAAGKLYYSSTSPINLSSANTKSTTTLSVSHTFSLTGLTASTTYYFIVESKDETENKATSSEISFTTQN